MKSKKGRNIQWLYLIMGFITLGFVMTIYLFLFSDVSRYSSLELTLRRVMILPEVICLVGMWKFKKWGVYGILTLTILSHLIGLFITKTSLFVVLPGILLATVMYFSLFKFYWGNFE